MSRIGKRVLSVPENVNVNVENNVVTVKGPKGELTLNLVKNIEVKVSEEGVAVTPLKDDKFTHAMHGTTNANIKNMIVGVSEGYKKGLEIVGVGYKFNVQGNKLTVSAGYSHPVVMEAPKELSVTSESNTEITIHGIDKQKVSEFAANVRKVREPEPYKGKGIRYKGEKVRRKEGKKAA